MQLPVAIISGLALLALPCCQESNPSHAAPSPDASPLPRGSPAPSVDANTSQCELDCSDIESCRDGRCQGSCPDGEVYIPATGPEGFVMGNGAAGEPNQKHVVVLTKPFCMDATEVTVGAYRECVEAGRCTLPELNDTKSNYLLKRENHPVNMVTWHQALNYCELRGQDLPTEAQFEWAAGGGKDRYPWGHEDPTCENALADFTPGGAPKSTPAGDVGCRGGNTSPVKAHPKGKRHWNGGDLFDLAGNVWEWTKDCNRPYPAGPETDPHRRFHPDLENDCFVYSLRGGGWNRSRYALRVYYRGAARRNYHVPGLGFRCVRNPTATLEPSSKAAPPEE